MIVHLKSDVAENVGIEIRKCAIGTGLQCRDPVVRDIGVYCTLLHAQYCVLVNALRTGWIHCIHADDTAVGRSRIRFPHVSGER